MTPAPCLRPLAGGACAPPPPASARSTARPASRSVLEVIKTGLPNTARVLVVDAAPRHSNDRRRDAPFAPRLASPLPPPSPGGGTTGLDAPPFPLSVQETVHVRNRHHAGSRGALPVA